MLENSIFREVSSNKAQNGGNNETNKELYYRSFNRASFHDLGFSLNSVALQK